MSRLRIVWWPAGREWWVMDEEGRILDQLGSLAEAEAFVIAESERREVDAS